MKNATLAIMTNNMNSSDINNYINIKTISIVLSGSLSCYVGVTPCFSVVLALWSSVFRTMSCFGVADSGSGSVRKDGSDCSYLALEQAFNSYLEEQLGILKTNLQKKQAQLLREVGHLSPILDQRGLGCGEQNVAAGRKSQIIEEGCGAKGKRGISPDNYLPEDIPLLSAVPLGISAEFHSASPPVNMLTATQPFRTFCDAPSLPAPSLPEGTPSRQISPSSLCSPDQDEARMSDYRRSFLEHRAERASRFSIQKQKMSYYHNSARKSPGLELDDVSKLGGKEPSLLQRLTIHSRVSTLFRPRASSIISAKTLPEQVKALEVISEDIDQKDECFPFRLAPEWADGLSSFLRPVASHNLEQRFARPLASEGSDSSDTLFVKHFILPPHSLRRLSWDMLSSAIVLREAGVLSLSMIGIEFGTLTTWQTIGLGFFWLADMIVGSLTAYHRDDGVLETDYSLIVKKYIKGTAALDFTLVILTFMGLWMKSTAVNMLRLLRVHRMKVIAKVIDDNIRSEKVRLLFDLLLKMFAMMCVVHLLACSWVGIGSLSENGCLAVAYVYFSFFLSVVAVVLCCFLQQQKSLIFLTSTSDNDNSSTHTNNNSSTTTNNSSSTTNNINKTNNSTAPRAPPPTTATITTPPPTAATLPTTATSKQTNKHTHKQAN